MLNKAICYTLILFLFSVSTLAIEKKDSIKSAEDLLKKILGLNNKNKENLTFSQQITFYNEEGGVLRTLTAYVSRKPNGFQRLDVVPLKDLKATLYKDDSIFELQDSKLAFQKKVTDPEIKMSLIPAEYTILFLSSATTKNSIEKLKEIGFDFTKFHEESWQNRKVYVVGADQGDLRNKQFWIDRERLVLVRLIQPGKKKETGTFDLQFNNYQKVKNKWEFSEALYNFNNKPERKVVRTNLLTVKELSDDAFSTDKFVKPEWIKEQ